MKKSLLLAGVACLISYNASAMDMGLGMGEMAPYVGLDYAYSHAKMSKHIDPIKKDYNSGVINAGVKMGNYASLEAFFQQSGERKTDKFVMDGIADKVKSKFYAYGVDAYGYMPVGCDGFNLLGTVGIANYNIEAKGFGDKYDKDRVGYRVGLGAQYDYNENWSARVVARYSYLDSKVLDNLQEITAGVRYTF